MINIRSEKGSITLFVLISCFFFIASITCATMYTKNKQIAVDRDYRQIKYNYEKNSLDEENLDNAYNEIEETQN